MASLEAVLADSQAKLALAETQLKAHDGASNPSSGNLPSAHAVYRFLTQLKTCDTVGFNALLGAKGNVELAYESGPEGWFAVHEVICSRAKDLSARTRCRVILAVTARGKVPTADQELIAEMILDTRGNDLSYLKNRLDSGDLEVGLGESGNSARGTSDLASIVLDCIESTFHRERVLAHFFSESAELRAIPTFTPKICFLSDAEDAMIETGQSCWGKRLPKGVMIPVSCALFLGAK